MGTEGWPSWRKGSTGSVATEQLAALGYSKSPVTKTAKLLLAGIETTRITGPRLAREPEAVVESVRRHLARRGAR